ncbi:MAG: LamG-like jellyroll fold domain-containing protein [Anaerolineae bacterium]
MASLVWAAGPSLQQAGDSSPAGRQASQSPAKAVQQAWQRARDAGIYRFTTDLTAIAYPAPTLANTGQPGRKDELYMEGSVDLPAGTLLLSLWQGAGSVLNPGDGIEVRIEGNRAYGRQTGGQWQEIDDFSGSFAPGGDLLVYLAGAKNVVDLGTETIVVPAPGDAAAQQGDGAAGAAPSIRVEYARYGFELDGPALAEKVRQQWQEQLLKQGGLPTGVEAQAPAALRDVTGHGELWLDSEGLPARLTVEIAYPRDAEKDDGGGRATIRTDFAGFPPQEEAQAPRLVAALGLGGLLGPDPAGWLADRVDARQLGAHVALFLIVVGLSWLVMVCRRSRRVYVAVVLTVILSMVVTPLADSHRVAAYGEQQSARRAAYEERQEKARAQQEYQEAIHTNQWDPTQDPLAALAGPQEDSVQANTGEALIPLPGSYPITEVLADEPPPAPESDADGDTLSYIEEIRLGTDPDDADSDHDYLRDDLEVQGFLFKNPTTGVVERYYSDPLSADTNNDGVGDIQECWASVQDTNAPWSRPCDLDTDGDGEPDIFDGDNDNDGVPDGVDRSPFDSMGTFSASNPFQLKVDQLQSDVLTFVDLQIRPTDAAQLTYAFNVLDWPSDDTEGQIQRVLDTTFADSMTEEERAKDPRSANGDLRLIPMVEVRVPYIPGHTRNLPVQAGWTGTLGTTSPPLEDWVDMKVLEQYGVTVRYADQAGNLRIYAPLSLVSDETGGASVAFTTRLPYQAMASGNWGSAHEIHFIWALQMLVDQCKEVPAGEDAESWCLEPENREEQIQIVHTYDEPWTLSGLSVREDHGVDLLIAFEDPVYDTDLEDDQNLYALAQGLDRTWISARDCDTLDPYDKCQGDGNRDIDIPEIEHRFDNSSNSDIPDGDEDLWGIPKTAFKIFPVSVAYQDLLASVPMTHTKEVLNDSFLVNGQARTEAPLLMFIREERYRIATLESQAQSLLTVTMPAEQEPDTLAAMSWAPFRYRAEAWEPYPMDEYLELFDPRMKEIIPVDPNDPDGQLLADGDLMLARGFFLAMVQGTEQIVETHGQIRSQFDDEEEAENRDVELRAELIQVAGEAVLVIIEIAGKQLVEYAIGVALVFFEYSKAEWRQYLGAIYEYIQAKGGFIGWNAKDASPIGGLSRFQKLGIATLIISTIFAVVLFAFSWFVDADSLKYVQNGLRLAASVLRLIFAVRMAYLELKETVHTAEELLPELMKLFKEGCAGIKDATAATLVVAIIIEAAVALAIFIYAVVSSHTKAFSLAFDQMLVDMIARIVVAALLWALSLIPVVGEILYLIVVVLNAIASLICSFFSEEKQQEEWAQWVCGGISSILAHIFSWIFYGQNLIVDIEDEDRWQAGVPYLELGDPAKGLAVGNRLSYSLTLTNSIHVAKIPGDWKAAAYGWMYTPPFLKYSTFAYEINGEEEAELHEDLKLRQQISLWEEGPKRDDRRTFHIAYPVETEDPGLPLVTAGVNITNSVYIHEGYALPVQECIAVPTPVGFPPVFWILVPVCWVRATKGTGSAELGDLFPWDIFPETLTKFYERAEVDGGYSLAWLRSGDLPFGRQVDFDGDSLRNKIDGGPDPDDSTWDYDNDGLSDYFETQIGTKVDAYDPDGDGLSDREELLLGTNPFRADTDGDGLTDRQERDGWEFAYGFDLAGQPKMTWVRSDPLMFDSDFDNLTDLQEYNYRYHPRVAGDSEALSFGSTLSELTLSGAYETSDGTVRSGDQLRYEASVENKTLLSSAQGLHAASFDTDRLSGSVAPSTFHLYPQEKKTLSGDLTVKSGIPSGPADLTQTAGARITYALADSDYAQLVLHLEDPATATTFVDSSGSIPPHDGECTGTQCPTRQVAGYIGSAVQFDATKSQFIRVPGADITAGDLGISFWFKTSQPGAALLTSGADQYVQLFLKDGTSGGQVCTRVYGVVYSIPACSEKSYADNQWHHLALTFQNGSGLYLFIDGQQVVGGYQGYTRINSYDKGVSLGSMRDPSLSGMYRYYTGLLDEVVVYDRALTRQEIAALYGQTLLAMHLDEPPGATSFAEDSGLTATCPSSIYCPTTGRPGAVRQSASFSSGDFIQVPTLPPLESQFTMTSWILPTGTDSDPQGIAGRLTQSLITSAPTLMRVGSGIKAAFGARTSLVEMDLVPDVLNLNAWNHVVLTYGANQDGKGQFDLYVNGVRRGQQVLSSYPIPYYDSPSGFMLGNPWALTLVNQNYVVKPFTGQIDEVLIYPYVLTEAQVDEVYRNQSDALHLPFDEPPGTYQFQDALRRATGTCPADLVTCPTAGVPGRSGQAAFFDGVDNSLDAGTAPAVTGTGPLSVAAWVRTSAAKSQVIVNQRSAAVFNGEYVFSLNSAGKVVWYTYGNNGAAQFSLASAQSVNDGEWHHVAGVRDESGSSYVYIDGALDTSLPNTDPTKIAPLVATNVYVGADMRDHTGYFDGLIDELHIVRRALSAAEVQTLVRQAPSLLLHLEAEPGEYLFLDDTELGHDATCATSHCPKPGITGQINLAADFDGVDDLLMSDYEVPASADMTFMAWVQPASTSAGRHMVVDSADCSLFREGATWHVGAGPLDWGGDFDTGAQVQPGVWQHVAVVYSGNTARFFLNGHPWSDLSIGALPNGGSIGVGYMRYGSGDYYWDGQIDELAIYERAMTDTEIEALWRYQGQWVQEMARTPLTVDNDKPTSVLSYDHAHPYQPNQPVNLLIQTADATSSVVRAEWQLDSNSLWQSAPPCGAEPGAAWCPTLDPTALHGPGAYVIRTRAIDKAGNYSDTSFDTLYVDGGAPTVAITAPQDGALVKLASVPTIPNGWKLSIAGTVSEPPVASGVPGSGIRSVKVTLLDAYGRPAGDGIQQATVNGTAWSAQVILTDPIDDGAYTILAEADDQVNNVSSATATVYLDRTAPEASLAGLSPGGATLVLHLDEAAGATRFADSSGYAHDAVCGATCPTAGLPGKYGQAVELDGTDQSLAVIDTLSFGPGDFTLAAWFQTSSQTWQTIAAATTTDSPVQDVLLLQVTNGGKVRFTFIAPGDTAVTNLTSPPGFHDGQWHHAAVVRSGSEFFLYVDGEIVADKTDDRALSNLLQLALGQHSGAESFTGRLDEVYVIPLALSSAEVHDLAFVHQPPALATLSGVVSEVPLSDGSVMALHLEETSGEVYADGSAWANHATCSGTTCPVQETSGTFFGQALHFDGIDDRLGLLNSSALWSLQENWTLSAWIQPDRLSGDQQILAYPQGSTGFAFGTHGTGLRFTAFGVGTYDSTDLALKTGTWQQVGMRLSGGDLTFYVDGVAREVITGTQLLQPNLIETDSVYVGMTTATDGSTPAQLFQGGIDEVLLFNQALSQREVLALGARKHAGVAGLEMALTPAVPGSPLYNAPMPQGALLYLPLDDTETASGDLQFLDISGQSHAVSCSGTACPSVGHGGHAAGAALFDGTDDYLDIPLNVSETGYALALWFKTECANCGIFSVDAGTLGADGHDRHVYLGSGNVCARVWDNESICTSGTNYADGQWHQVVHTFGDTEGGQKLYLDGALGATGAQAVSDFDLQDGINIGFSNDAAQDYFSGLLDEVILFNRALPAAEVRTLYFGSEPVLHLPLDASWATGGLPQVDASGWEQNGTLYTGGGDGANKAVPGQVGSFGLQLDGVDDYIRVPDGATIDFAYNEDFAVALWVKADVQVNTQYADNDIVEKWAGSLGYPYVIRYQRASGIILAARYDGTNNPNVTSQVRIDDGKFHHVTFIKQGENLYLYIDGVLEGSAADTTTGDTTNQSPLYIGQRGYTGNNFKGTVDDLRIYARALSAEEVQALAANRWRNVALTQTGAGVVRSSYSTSLGDLDLEGYYRIDLRGVDGFDNRTDTTQGRGLWHSVLDSIAPRAELKYQITTIGLGQQVHYEFSAHDFGLTEQGFVSPCPDGTPLTREYFNAPWYRAWTGQTAANSDRLWALSGQCDVAYSGALAGLTACDVSAQCTTISAEPLVPTTGVQASAAPGARAGAAGVLILEPAAGTILSTTLPISIRGAAFSPDYLKRLTLRDGTRVIETSNWAPSTITDTIWTTSWTPQGEGPHQIEVQLTDWAGVTFTDTATVILDQTPPAVGIATTVLTTTHLAGGQVRLNGTASDATGLAGVDVQVDGGHWRPASLYDDTWAVSWLAGLTALPDGESHTVTARATDRAGWETLNTEDLWVDLVAPAPVNLALSVEFGDASQTITQTGITIREPGATLQMTWSASSDGSGLAGYRAGWTAVEGSGASTTTWTEVDPTGIRQASTTAGEAQKLTASLASRDLYGNTAWQSFVPIYADSPLTPDYIPLDDPDGTYHGWMEGGCSLLGVDRRLSRVASPQAMLRGEQALYATWDGEALRLAWTGANWSADGDLFLYFDTTPGGSSTAFNPYSSAVAGMGEAELQPSVLLTLPGSTAIAPEIEVMEADYGVWVQDGQTAYLLSWDGAAWITSTLQTGSEFRYQPSRKGGLTDLLLPFERLGITDPALTSLKLLAFATEEDALSLWAVLPRANPVTSLLAGAGTGYTLDALSVPLTHFYQWPSLGSGICPNGTRYLLASGQTPYPEADLQVNLTADPTGIIYQYLGDHLFPWADYLLGDKPLDFSNLLTFLDRDLPFVHDGQVLTYTLHVQNNGQEAAQAVAALASTRGALILPDGAPIEDEEYRYFQEVPIGDLAPGEARTVSFSGRVDLAWAQPRYEECLATYPDRPRLCSLILRMALLKVEIVDQTYTTDTGPLERIWADHRVDSEAPRFVGISWPGLHISPGGVELRGYAYDDSGVPYLSLEVQRPDGSTISLPCPNPAPADGSWRCQWDPTAVNGGVTPEDGQIFQVRLRATDEAGLMGDPGPWQPFVVDAVPPTVTAQLPPATASGLPASLRTLRLGGRLIDNRGAAGVTVCLEDTCQNTQVTLEGPPQLHTYADEPATPVLLATCDSAPIQRTFVVTDTFVLRGVALGLRSEHGDRDQIQAELISPAGTRVRVLSGEEELGSDYQHYAVLLTDAAGAALSQLVRDHDLALPGFVQAVRPDEPLSAFVGEEAAGAWTLTLCDTDALGEQGTYLAGRLILQPQDTAAPNGAWFHSLSLPEMDGVAQTLTVYGWDDAGNRTTEPFTHTIIVDNVAPKISITDAVAEVQMTPELTATTVLSGTVADGSLVRRLFAAVNTPDGQLHLQPVTRQGDGWSFALDTRTAGTHTVRIVAEDLAGNRTTIGPVPVTVRGIHQPYGQELYLPLILRASSPLTIERLYLPLVLRGVSRYERVPVPTATVGPSPTAVPTITLTPSATITLTATTTPTLVPTATDTPATPILPTWTLTPVETGTPVSTATLTPTLTVTLTVTSPTVTAEQ